MTGREKLSVSKEDLKFFNDLFESLKAPIKKNELKKQLLIKGLKNEEFIDESLRYLILGRFVKLLNNDELVLLEIPDIELREERNIMEFPKLIMTLPPYNIYGLSDKMENTEVMVENLESAFMKLFETARKTIFICSPFLEYNGIERFMPLLLDKARTGVKINILTRQVSKRDSNNRYEQIRKIKGVFEEHSLSVVIRNYHYFHHNRVDSSIHAKMIICDFQLAYVGSGELRRNSFEKNFEVGVILKGEKARELGLIFENLFDVSEEIDWRC